MLQVIFGYVQFVHAALILYLTLQLYKYPNQVFDINLVIAETVLTVLDVFLIRKTFNVFSVLISLSLFSTFLPSDLSWIVVLFLGKIIYINDILSSSKQLFFSGDNCSFCQLGGIIYNFIRFTFAQYLFLGIVITAYKIIVLSLDQSGVELPENYVLFYQMIVTATTIGYGDVCPKSRIQMNFFIGAIPFICGSFVIYGNNVNPLWEEFLNFWNGSSATSSSASLIQSKSMTPAQKQSLNQFAVLSAEKRRQLETLKQTYFNDWISIASINYEKQADLVNTIIDPSFSKQYKLAISSKIRQQYFPKNWVIIDSNDINSDLYMIADGEVDFNGEIKSAGFIFNQKGFFCQAISDVKVITNSFVTVWAINLAELEELGINCPLIKDKINQNIAAHS